MLRCETPVARAANRDRRTMRRWLQHEGVAKGGERRQRETEGERCACSPSNCALRAVAGNERGAMGGGVHSILFVLLLPFLFVPFPSFLLTPRSFPRPSLHSLLPSLSLLLCFLWLSSSYSFCLRYLARSYRQSLIRWPTALLHL